MHELEIIRGDTPTIRLSGPDGGPLTRPNVSTGVEESIDLTGAIAKLTVRTSVEAAEPVFAVDGTPDPAAGIVAFVLSEAQTNALTPGEVVFDVEVREAAGTVTTFPRKPPGRMRVLADVTHPAV